MGGIASNNLPDLQPGDCLLYRPNSFFGWLIAVKTFNRISHVEVYRGEHLSYASRDGVGVGLYRLRRAQLARVLRPAGPFDNAAARRWFWQEADGQKYDWLGLLCFTLAVKQGASDRMFCSEFATRFYRAGGLEPFQPDYDADHVPPSYFLSSGAFTTIWKAAP
jgi:hypothetical protein